MSNDLVIRRLSEQVSIDASDPIAKLSWLEQLQRATGSRSACSLNWIPAGALANQHTNSDWIFPAADSRTGHRVTIQKAWVAI